MLCSGRALSALISLIVARYPAGARSILWLSTLAFVQCNSAMPVILSILLELYKIRIDFFFFLVRYQKLWKQYMKFKHLLSNKQKVSDADKQRLKALEDLLQELRLAEWVVSLCCMWNTDLSALTYSQNKHLDSWTDEMWISWSWISRQLFGLLLTGATFGVGEPVKRLTHPGWELEIWALCSASLLCQSFQQCPGF